jgi:hypothetical protein
MRRASVVFTLTLTVAGLLLLRGGPAVRDRMSGLPRLVLWAWERPERIDYPGPQPFGVAFLAQTIRLKNGGCEVRPRLQPLEVASGCPLIAVTRIETAPGAVLAADSARIAQLAEEIAQVLRPRVSAVQIDFDALASEREFYRRLITEVRQRLPDRVRLSITALASWCVYDTWLKDLPVDEAVPMLFRMGPDRPEMLARLAAGGDFGATICRQSAGVSLDERLPAVPSGRRLYVFNPQSWSAETVNQAARLLGK